MSATQDTHWTISHSYPDRSHMVNKCFSLGINSFDTIASLDLMLHSAMLNIVKLLLPITFAFCQLVRFCFAFKNNKLIQPDLYCPTPHTSNGQIAN